MKYVHRARKDLMSDEQHTAAEYFLFRGLDGLQQKPALLFNTQGKKKFKKKETTNKSDFTLQKSLLDNNQWSTSGDALVLIKDLF